MSKIDLNGDLIISTQTWDKDTNGLFDFCSKDIETKKESIKDTTCLIRENNSVKKILNDDDKPGEEKLFKIIKKEGGKYLFENKIDFNMEPSVENISKINNNLWYVINDDSKLKEGGNNKIKNMNYYLTKNDIIKLGRLKFKIIEDSLYSGDKKFELNIPENASFINKQNSKQKAVFDLVKNVQCLKKENTEENILCRICYLEEDDRINNPMVHLCNCKGGINYAHFNCIKHWMRTKLMILINKKQTVKTYYIPRFNCEICKKPYPFRFKLDGNENKIFELIDIERPKCNYIIMESLDQVKENNNNKYINVIKIINENDITIGRGIEADIKINDISVSRFHCRLNFNFSNKSLVLTDLKSKFGTLVLIQDSFELKEKDNLIMQSGRTLIKAEVKEKKKIFACKKVNEGQKSKIEKVVKNSFINKQLKGGNKIIINFEDNMKKNLDNFLFAKLEKNMGKKLIEKESKDNSIDMDLEINA